MLFSIWLEKRKGLPRVGGLRVRLDMGLALGAAAVLLSGYFP
jgi:hypothetical protein